MTSEEENNKLEVLGLIAADNSPASLRKIAEERGMPYSRLLKWRRELQSDGEDGKTALLIHADRVMLHRIAEETSADLAKLKPGVVVQGDVEGVIEAIDGLGILNERMQKTAIKLANRIDGLAAGVVDVKDLNSLVNSLSTLQMAFFNKQSTTVNVQNNTYTSEDVNKFKKLKRD